MKKLLIITALALLSSCLIPDVITPVKQHKPFSEIDVTAEEIGKALAGVKGTSKWKFFRGEVTQEKEDKGEKYWVVENNVVTSENDIFKIQYTINLQTDYVKFYTVTYNGEPVLYNAIIFYIFEMELKNLY